MFSGLGMSHIQFAQGIIEIRSSGKSYSRVKKSSYSRVTKSSYSRVTKSRCFLTDTVGVFYSGNTGKYHHAGCPKHGVFFQHCLERYSIETRRTSKKKRLKNKHSGHEEKKNSFKYFILKSLSMDRRVAAYMILLIFLHFYQLALFIVKIV